MANRSFESLVYKVSPSVPGCPQPTIVQYIRDAAIRTCERTLYWRYQIPLFNLQPGVVEYPYNKPQDTDVHAVFEALVDCSPLDRMTLEQAIYRYPCWADLYNNLPLQEVWGQTPSGSFNSPQYNQFPYNSGGQFVFPEEALEGAGDPRIICQITPDKYIVLPPPDDEKDHEMRMFVALKPKRNAEGMDEFIFDELEDVIMHNALQHLLVLPESNWTDRELAAYHAKQYLFHLTERRARANLGNARANMTARMQPFGV